MQQESSVTGVGGATRREFAGAVAAAGGAALALGCLASPAQAAHSPTYEAAASTDPESVEAHMYPWEAYAAPSVAPLAEVAAQPRRVLVVVDYQQDFCDGALGRIEPAVALEDAIYDLVKSYQDAGDIVIYTMDTHPADNYPYTREATFNSPHCEPGTPGWQVYGKVADLLTPEKAIRLMKGTFASTELVGVIQRIKSQGVAIESIEVAGVSTTCRVLHTVVLLYNFFPETMLVMDSRTTAGYTDEQTAEQLKTLEGWGVVVKW